MTTEHDTLSALCMPSAEAIRRLEQLAKLLEHTIATVRRKRGMRQSEKAMTLANYAQDVLAIKCGIAALKSGGSADA